MADKLRVSLDNGHTWQEVGIVLVDAPVHEGDTSSLRLSCNPDGVDFEVYAVTHPEALEDCESREWADLFPRRV